MKLERWWNDHRLDRAIASLRRHNAKSLIVYLQREDIRAMFHEEVLKVEPTTITASVGRQDQTLLLKMTLTDSNGLGKVVYFGPGYHSVQSL